MKPVVFPPFFLKCKLKEFLLRQLQTIIGTLNTHKHMHR